jgi:hypothetical protein
MKSHKDDWLEQKMMEDLTAMDEERVRFLMESEELQDIEMSPEKLEETRQKLLEQKPKKKRVPARVLLVAAVMMVLLIGAGVVSSGAKLYVPVIFQRERGDEVATTVNNMDVLYSEYEEEKVCQEIEEKLGVLPVRLIYRPKGMVLDVYTVDEENKESLLCYKYEQHKLYVYICKEYREATINYQTDGEILDTIMVESCGMEVPVYVVDDTKEGEYYMTSFEYLNTYYFFSGMMDWENFKNILENIAIKND